MACDYARLTAEELLNTCADCGNHQAWEEFLRRFHSVVLSVVSRTIRRYSADATTLCQDLAQDVYLKLSAHNGRLLRAFVPEHPGSAYGFIKVVSANLVHDHFKSKSIHSRRQQVSLPDDLETSDDLERHLFERGVDDVLRKHVAGRERRIFWLYYKQGFTAQEIANLPSLGLSVKGIESVLVRLRAMIRAEFAVQTTDLGAGCA